MDIKLKVQGILADPRKEDQIAILRGEKGNTILPVWISVAEGNAIRLGLEGIIPDRPMSHELIESILSNLKLSITKIVLMELSPGVFCAKLHMKKNKEIMVVDSLPGDAIALALRTNTPIYASKNIIEQSGAKNLDEWLANFSDKEDEYDA